jgi:acyl-CoA synthetase (AMP-forming)/AMP-acid ligase II
MAIIDFFDRGWSINPKGAAYVQDGRSYSYDEVGQFSCRIANGLLSLGLSKQTKCAVWALNDVVAWTCTLGIWRANMCFIPLGARNSADENRGALEAFDCEALFFQRQFAQVIDELRPRLPRIRLWLCIDDAGEELAGSRSLVRWIADQSAVEPEVTVDMDDEVMLSLTGGTTGTPKGVLNTHRSIQTFCAHLLIACPYGAERQPVNLAAAPMTHTAGLLSLPCTARGGTVVVVTKPDPTVLLQAIQQYRVTELFLPPTVIYRLLDLPNLGEQVDFSSLKYFMYGAAPMSVAKLKRAVEVFGPVMMGGYGQTEAPASIAFLSPAEHVADGKLASDERLSSVGRPNPLIRVEIKNERYETLPQGATGEICVSGDLVMKGYYNAPERTAETIVDGWLHTGDLGHIDSDGYLHITDRKKDVIITGGFNVYPSEVEQVIWDHPAVRDCAVIGVPDEQWGEAVTAIVELRGGLQASAGELIALCKERLGAVKAPKSVEFVDLLPRSPVGKVLKKDLREPYWRHTGRKV